MDTQRLKEQVETIRQAFGYINRYQGKTFVLKIEGSLIDSPCFPILIKDMVLLHRMGIRIVLVPGARDRINEVLKTFNQECRMVNGIRISPAEAIPLIKMAAFDVSNKIMTMLAENSTGAIIGNFVRARAIGVREGTDYKSSGLVDKLDAGVTKRILDQDLVPIFPNIGWALTGKPYNISSNELALTAACELNASKLFFVTNAGGINRNSYSLPEGVHTTSQGTVSQMTVAQAKEFLRLNRTSSYDEVIELANLAHQACSCGIPRVHIVDGRIEGVILKEIFSNRGIGTMVYGNQHEYIRPITHADVPEVLRILQPGVEKGILVARTASELEENVRNYVAYEVDGTLHGCAALKPYPDGSGEIHSVGVDEAYSKLGIGRRLVEYLIEAAPERKISSLFLLTTQTYDWFTQLGFVEGSPSDLPPEKQKTYDTNRNSRVLMYRIPRSGNLKRLQKE